MATTIVTKNGTGAPTDSDLVAGELAVDLTNGRLYTTDLDSGGTVIEIGLNPSGNVDVTGTVTADGLTVDGVADFNANNINYTGSSPKINFFENDATDVNTQLVNTVGDFYIKTVSDDAGTTTNRFSLDHATGDISFYEDTGTTAKFFWDASAESLGIGTSSPRSLINASSATGAILTLESSDTTLGENEVVGQIDFYANDASTNSTGNKAFIKAYSETAGGNKVGLDFATASSDSATGIVAMTIDSNRNVGIGAVPANGRLHVTAASGVVGWFETTGLSGALGISNSGTFGMQIDTASSSGFLTFTKGSGTTEFGRFDTDGNLLVGKTAPNSATAGVQILPEGDVGITRNGSHSLLLNRLTSDGDIALFRKDGTTVGSIGVKGVDLTIGTTVTGLQFFDGGDALAPVNVTTNTNTDGATDLGISNARFKDLYLSGGAYLGGTGAANKLDDYEEGTWTPTVTSSVGTITSVTSQIGTYTKIGRTVIVQYQFNIATLGTASGNIIVSGRPFTEDNSEISYYAGVHRARAGSSSITEFDFDGTFQLYGTTPVTNVYLGSMVYNTTA